MGGHRGDQNIDPAHPDWTPLQLYVIQEHIEDFNDGLISRRQMLRKVTWITGSLAVTLAVLPTLGCSPAATTAPSATAAASNRVASPTAVATAAASPYALPPAARSGPDGVTVKADDPRITAGPVSPGSIKGADGAVLIGYLARPKAEGTYPAVLVVHENVGLTPHIQDVVRRVATAGFTGLSIDLLSRQGGAEKLGGTYSAELAKTTPDAMTADLKAALEFLKAHANVKADALAVTGFCFGGGTVWNLLVAGGDVKAAAPFYGPAPANIAGLATTKAAVSAVYAELDTRITSTAPQIEEQLKKTGRPYKTTVYPGVNHAFHNDTGERYVADQAQKAWQATIEWFKQYAT
ncbi:MAG: dienelactone hydrolase family protein [Chloroflexi bacterium]|nr:dienelactone hydrolase family protein [Chloroflexota bacterium]